MTDADVPFGGGHAATTSTSLLARARANDREAWERVVYLYSPLVYAWCRRFGLQDADTLDVSQDVLRLAYLHIGAFRKDRPGDSFRKWLKTVTRNRVLDVARRKSRTPAAQGGSEVWDVATESSDDVDADPAEQESERILALRRALEMVRGEFEPKTWDAFWRATVDEKSAAEIAKELAISANSVYLAKSRVLRRLNDMFGELIEGLSS